MIALLRRSLISGVLLAGAIGLHAQAIITIAFDDIAAFSMPAEQYAPFGVHFSTGSAGVQNGLANGDSGSWGVNGTAGAFFLGFNGPTAPDVQQTDPYRQTITFDFTATTVSLDVSRTSGSAPTDTFTLKAFAGATPVATQTLTLATINTWQTVTLSNPGITSIQLLGEGTGFHPFGIDNLKFSPVPEPATWSLLGAGLLGAFWLRRRR